MNELELTISSIKIQTFKDIYKMNVAFDKGTIFKQFPSLEVITIFFRTTFKPFLSICRFYRLFLYF